MRNTRKDIPPNNYARDSRVENTPVEPGKRFKWLSEVVNKQGFTRGAEIGCAGGNTTGWLLRNCPHLNLIAVDLWGIPGEGSGQYDNWNFSHVYNTFQQNTRRYNRRLKVLRGLSQEMAEEVEDGSLDFIFIDADHCYESVIKDIRAWTPKLKDGGMISGHDTHFVGVLEAINDIIPEWKATGVDHVWYAKKEDVKC